MNYQQYARDFWEQGYLVIENFFTDGLMDHLNQVILAHFGRNPDWEHSDDFIQKSATEVIPWFPLREGDTNFQAIEKDELLKNLTQRILGEGWNPFI